MALFEILLPADEADATAPDIRFGFGKLDAAFGQEMVDRK
jgi:hypothetical protein